MRDSISAVVTGVIVGLLLLGAASYVGYDAKHRAQPAPAAASAVEAPDSWVLRRIEACDKVCGPVPFEVEATRDSIRCTCGRPAKVERMKLPKPEVKS